MRCLFILLLLIPQALEASDMTMEIEKKAAKLKACSVDKPCIVSISETEDHYVAKVSSSALITEYGVLKFTTGSITFYIFDKNGQLLETKRTT